MPSSRAAHPCRLISQQQPGKRRPGNKWLALSVATALCVLGFPGTASAAATSGGLQLTVSPKVSAADTPLRIRLSGLQPGAKATLSVSSVDAAGIKWSSSGMFVASSAGTVDPATSSPQGSLATGTMAEYTGTDPMGPVDFMSAPTSASEVTTPTWPFGLPNVRGTLYWWAKCSVSLQGQHGCSWSKPLSFTFTAASGHERASVTVQRGPAAPVTARFESVAARGFYGVFWQPPASQDNHIGLVVFDGDFGGMTLPVAPMLASRGYPTLDLAYFDEPGLPQTEHGISLEYFAKALRWLGPARRRREAPLGTGLVEGQRGGAFARRPLPLPGARGGGPGARRRG